MKRAAFFLAALLLVVPARGAADPPSGTAAKDKPVVVEPLDLRQPVPDPQAELYQKYDGKTVRFTGVLHSWGTAAKIRWFEFQTEVPQAAPTPGNKGAKAKTERVAVRVYFQQDDKRLRPQPSRVPLTVEGTGEVLVDGALVIRGARIVTSEATLKR